jgi:hypothetical protein
MKTFPNANQLSGRAIGSIFFACFGTGWLFLALTAEERITPGTVTCVLLCMLILLLASLYLLNQSKRWPRVPNDPAIRRAFVWINGIQWTAVALVVIVLGRMHFGVYATSAIAAIIGMHLFPLARLFRYPLHYVTGALLVGWAVVSAIFVPPEHMQGLAALGTGIILWLSALVTLTIALNLARQPISAQTVG